MEFTEDFEKVVRLIAHAFAKTSGNQSPHIFADGVVANAKILVADSKEEVAETPELAAPVVVTPVDTVPVLTDTVEPVTVVTPVDIVPVEEVKPAE